MSSDASSLFLSVGDISETFADLQDELTALYETRNKEIDFVPVCAIDYPSSFSLAHDTLEVVRRQQLESNCSSDSGALYRQLQLSATCLKQNPANYTNWRFRRQCVQALIQRAATKSSDTADTKKEGGETKEEDESSAVNSNNDEKNPTTLVRQELYLTELLGGSNPKNYQIWYHRRALLEFLLQEEEPSATAKTNALLLELFEEDYQFVGQVIEDDSKNYHAWSHRQWLIPCLTTLQQRVAGAPPTSGANEVTASIWDRELEYVTELIAEDVRNNSAWNQRWFVIHNKSSNSTTAYVPPAGSKLKHPRGTGLTKGILDQELAFALTQGAALDPYNESPWTYLLALIKEEMRGDRTNDDQKKKDLLSHLLEQVESLRSVLVEHGRDPVDACTPWTAARIDLLELMGSNDAYEKAIALAKCLKEEHDQVRANYWSFRINNLSQLSQSS